MSNNIWSCLKVLPTDYDEYGGEIKRWADPAKNYPDCSCGCKFFVTLSEPYSYDWGVCTNPNAPRKGMLTWEHIAGFNCFEAEKNGQ